MGMLITMDILIRKVTWIGGKEGKLKMKKGILLI